MADPGFVHLRAFFLFAIAGCAAVARFAELAKADRQPALALTDTDNMFGALEFSEKIVGAASSQSSAAPLPSTLATRRRAPGAGAGAPPYRSAGGARGWLPQPNAPTARLPREPVA
jgi:DNA polymerase-3 subunit alpha